MKLIDQIFENTISEYNKNASDINKFKFSEFEKIVFKNMMADYATECVKASLRFVFLLMVNVMFTLLIIKF